MTHEERFRIRNTVDLNALIGFAVDNLPEGWEVTLSMTGGVEASLSLEDPEGADVDVCHDDLSTPEMVVASVNAARERCGMEEAKFGEETDDEPHDRRFEQP